MTLLQDLRFALRMLRKSPGFAIFALLALALGIGANTAIFSLVNAVLLKPLSFRDPGRLVMVWEDARFMGFPENTPAPANYFDWKTRNHVFTDMAALNGDLFDLTGNGEQPEEVEAKRATANLFPLLGVKPVLGRTFLPEEDRPGGAQAISRGLWIRRFGADPRIIGKTILLNGEKHTVVGVLPPGFDLPDPVDVWVPMAFTTQQRANRGAHYLQVVARLRDGVTFQQAQADMRGIAAQLARQYPNTNQGIGALLVPLHRQFVGSLRIGLIALLAAVACVLLIACANVANLLLARAAGRRREMAVRTALGASRKRLIRQTLTESVFLSLAGGALGLLLADWSLAFLERLIPLPLTTTTSVSLDPKVLAFTLAVAVLAGVLFGLAPALRISSLSVADGLKEGTRGSAGSPANRLRGSLVVAEVALSTVLLIGSGLMIQTLFRLQGIDPGFQPAHVLCARTQLPDNPWYRDINHRVAFYRRVLARVEALPGVVSAGYTTFLPLTNRGGTSGFTIEGRPEPPANQGPDANHRVITPDYLHAIGVPLIAGRSLRESDGPDSPPVALVNQTMAAKYWPGENPIGRRFKLGDYGDNAPWIAVVGIVGDVRQMGLDVPSRSEMYFSYKQPAGSFGYFMPRDLAIRVAGNPLALAAALRQAVHEVDPNQPVSEIRPMAELLSTELAGRRMEAQLLGTFAALALLLASLGIYGVLAYGVTQRTPEIGLRMALGAQRRDVLRSIVASGLRLVAVGLAIGLAAAFGLARLIQSLLYGVTAADPLTFIGVAVVLIAVALAACYFPARRAARIDPMIALRYE